MWIYLSHKISLKTPSYGGGPGLKLQPYKQIERGDSSNSYIITLYNHLGTHVDAPNHFMAGGRSISQFRPEEFFFNTPVLIDIPKDVGGLVTREELEDFHDIIAACDILLLRTGFQRYREEDPDAFMSRGPCLGADAARYLRSFPKLRAVGVDMISISSPIHRDEGRKAHRELLSRDDFLIVEDMDLMGKPRKIIRIVIAPIMIEDVDSTPCLVLAEV